MNGNPKTEIASLFARGASFERTGQIGAAQAAYQRVLEIDRRNIQALILLGLLAIRADAPNEALPYFEKALKLNPASVELHNNLAMLFLHLGRPDKAEPHALYSAQQQPESLEVLKILHKCYLHLGKADLALAAIEKALRIQPGNPEFMLDLAQCHDVSGNPELAHELFQELIQLGHASIYAYDGLARTQKYQTEPPEYAQIQQRLSESNLSPQERSWLQRAAGKIADDLGRYDQAFAHFQASKSAPRAQARVDSFRCTVALLKTHITPDFFAARHDFGLKDRRPIFVFGMPRSGTSLVEQILASHPAVYGANEPSFFRDEAKRLSLDASEETSFLQALKQFRRKAGQESAREYLKLLAAYSRDAERVVDKMPLNFEVLWLLALLFPQATFIHCRRQAMATCVSCFIQPLGDMHVYADDLSTLGQYFRLYDELMAHWSATLPVRILDVHYEELVKNPETLSRQLIAHAGLEWHDNCLRFYEQRRSVRTPSRRQVEQPVYTSALEGWCRYEKHLQPLIQVLGDLA